MEIKKKILVGVWVDVNRELKFGGGGVGSGWGVRFGWGRCQCGCDRELKFL